MQVSSDAGDDLDLRGDQLAGDVLVQDRIALRCLAQLLEPGQQVERLRIEDRELLLHADGPVGGLREYLCRSV